MLSPCVWSCPVVIHTILYCTILYFTPASPQFPGIDEAIGSDLDSINSLLALVMRNHAAPDKDIMDHHCNWHRVREVDPNHTAPIHTHCSHPPHSHPPGSHRPHAHRPTPYSPPERTPIRPFSMTSATTETHHLIHTFPHHSHRPHPIPSAPPDAHQIIFEEECDYRNEAANLRAYVAAFDSDPHAEQLKQVPRLANGLGPGQVLRLGLGLGTLLPSKIILRSSSSRSAGY